MLVSPTLQVLMSLSIPTDHGETAFLPGSSALAPLSSGTAWRHTSLDRLPNAEAVRSEMPNVETVGTPDCRGPEAKKKASMIRVGKMEASPLSSCQLQGSPSAFQPWF